MNHAARTIQAPLYTAHRLLSYAAQALDERCADSERMTLNVRNLAQALPLDVSTDVLVTFPWFFDAAPVTARSLRADRLAVELLDAAGVR